jgi:hypothetical protein
VLEEKNFQKLLKIFFFFRAIANTHRLAIEWRAEEKSFEKKKINR